MSYILDALKKADRNRNPVAVPTLGTVHRAPEAARRRPRHWPWIVAAVIVVNAGVWIWLLRPPSVPDARFGGSTAAPVTVSVAPAPQPPAPRASDPVVAPASPDKPATPAPPAPPPRADRELSDRTPRPEPKVAAA